MGLGTKVAESGVTESKVECWGGVTTGHLPHWAPHLHSPSDFTKNELPLRARALEPGPLASSPHSITS